MPQTIYFFTKKSRSQRSRRKKWDINFIEKSSFWSNTPSIGARCTARPSRVKHYPPPYLHNDVVNTTPRAEVPTTMYSENEVSCHHDDKALSALPPRQRTSTFAGCKTRWCYQIWRKATDNVNPTGIPEITFAARAWRANANAPQKRMLVRTRRRV